MTMTVNPAPAVGPAMAHAAAAAAAAARDDALRAALSASTHADTLVTAALAAGDLTQAAQAALWQAASNAVAGGKDVIASRRLAVESAKKAQRAADYAATAARDYAAACARVVAEIERIGG